MKKRVFLFNLLLFQSIVNESRENNGFLIVANETNNNYIAFSSLENTTVADRPKWNITYTVGNNILPTYSDVYTNTTEAGEPCLFSVKYNDSTALHPNGQYIFSTNNTGSWVNDSAVNWTTTPEYANKTKTLNSTHDKVIGWRVYCICSFSSAL
mgnify:CR=1 FL=1